ncbi:BlaI/MecI/CopY family transcriptional regulator [Rubinisphaera brasiliensis]|uniref:Transcriptional repressor, CopY family n=1 Tax=Rubinisphaera brasiliensis (strain ATCC 49424 / DSM 5305 / JCM 21570 / IAM 15109 / NBRC 103401 / IFAM 1448) TaxID=756272 RepID=F0STK2_RUBBR|nr:BlaI/MecI/CopY family transcriptional regulator [Rubinisphaera brasiliensis]ADY61471.1 transcriptional repressor, CopY family [Rubinisphaera brasiliensis DSM 5305]
MQTPPTEREMAILKVLWAIGEGTVREVRQQLAPETGAHFNTIQTQLRIMDEKGLVAHRAEGRTFYYRAVCTRSQVSQHFLQSVFDGAVNELMLNMLDSTRLSDAELNDLERMIADARQKRESKRKGRK